MGKARAGETREEGGSKVGQSMAARGGRGGGRPAGEQDEGIFSSETQRKTGVVPQGSHDEEETAGAALSGAALSWDTRAPVH